MRLSAAFAFIACLCLVPPAAQALDTAAKAALVVEIGSGSVLLEKNADMSIPPASMSKLMTLNMVFEALRDGRLSLNDKFPVSEKAWRMGGSKMFLRDGSRVKIEDLIRGVIVQSGNDACVVLAEGLAGSEEAFADRMTTRARELGMSGSTFVNATGWPAEGHRMTARDLVFLANRLITEFPDYYEYFAEQKFTWEKIEQDNRNPLLYLDLGVDGLKTGHTEEAGFGLVASARRDDRRVILVVSGLESARSRASEGERLVSWAFREFRTRKMFEKGDPISSAEVWIGEETHVPLVAQKDILVTIPFTSENKIRAYVRYSGPVPAPIEAGQEIGELVIEAPNMKPVATTLVAGRAVPRGGFSARATAAMRILAGLVLDAGEDSDEAAQE